MLQMHLSHARMLLAKLHMDALEPQITRPGLREVLKNLPSDLDSAFRSTIDRIESQPNPQKQLARKVLMWVVGSRRPLTIGELRCAVALKVESPEFNSEEKPTESTITSVCAGLLVVDKEVSSRHHGWDAKLGTDNDSGKESSVVRLVRK